MLKSYVPFVLAVSTSFLLSREGRVQVESSIVN